MLQQIHDEERSDMTLDEFKHLLREQFFALLLDQEAALAARLEEQHSTIGDQIRYAFAWAYGRPATDAELVPGEG